MVLDFAKMNGAGNDFVVIDDRTQQLALNREQIVRLCDRHRGVGADGVLILVPCPSGKADWAWKFYNRDGSSGEMCGNGARCFARFVQRRVGLSQHQSATPVPVGPGRRECPPSLTFETEAGVIAASFEGERVTVSLTPPHDLRLAERVALAKGPQTIHSINTGVPHAVLFVPDADRAMVAEMGPEIRRHPHFGPKGTNVNFVQLLGPEKIRVRTFERGVEGETLACGTGLTASALIASRVHKLRSPVTVQGQSGDQLEVSFQERNGQFADVRLTGPAEFSFEGRIDL